MWKRLFAFAVVASLLLCGCGARPNLPPQPPMARETQPAQSNTNLSPAPPEANPAPAPAWRQIADAGRVDVIELHRTAPDQYAVGGVGFPDVVVGSPAFKNEGYQVMASDYEHSIVVARATVDPGDERKPLRFFIGKTLTELKEAPEFYNDIANRTGSRTLFTSKDGLFTLTSDGVKTKVGTAKVDTQFPPLSDDGTRIAYVAQEGLSIEIRDLNDQLLKTLPLTGLQEYQVRDVEWTGTENLLAIGWNWSPRVRRHMATLWVVPMTGEPPRLLVKDCVFALPPAGDKVAVWAEGWDAIRVLQLDGTKIQEIPLPHGMPLVNALAWFSDKLVLAGRADDKATLTLLGLSEHFGPGGTPQ